MKKNLLVLVAIIGFGISANAQCSIKEKSGIKGDWVKGDGNSWWGSSYAVLLTNTNDFTVKVRLDVEFVNMDGSKKTLTKTFTIKPNYSSETTEGNKAEIDSDWVRVDCDKSIVKITIL